MSNREKQAQLYEQYKDIDVTTLSDDDLDRQIVEMGRVDDYHAPSNPVHDLLEERKEQRWIRKKSQMNDIIQRGRSSGDWSELTKIIDAEKAAERLNSFAKDVYDDALETAHSQKQKLDAEGQPYRVIIEAQIIPNDFSKEANKYDEAYDGLLDMLMETEMMMAEFCPINFELRNGQEISCPTLEEALAPGGNRFSPLQDRDAMLAALFAKEYAGTPLTALPFPLQRLHLAYNVALQDIGAILTYDSNIDYYHASMSDCDAMDA